MKITALALVLCLSLMQPVSAQEESEYFMSWYNGWGTYTVWGIGKVASGSSGIPSVNCGNTQIEIKPIWDTHADIGEPNETQSADYAKANNLALLQKLEVAGKKCSFKLSE